jgi:hypothetical protein
MRNVHAIFHLRRRSREMLGTPDLTERPWQNGATVQGAPAVGSDVRRGVRSTNSPNGVRLNVSVGSGAKTLKGLSCPASGLPDVGRGQVEVVGYSKAPPADCEVGRSSAWEEHGRNLVRRFDPQALRGRSPREQPALAALTLRRRQGLLEGSKPRNRGLVGRPSAAAREQPAGETVRGFIRAETRRVPFGRRKLRRAKIPRALPV